MAVTQQLEALSLMPLHALSEWRDQSIPSLLHEITGLSKARISNGNLDAIRPTTQAKIDRHIEELLQEQFKGDPQELQSRHSHVASAPTTHSGRRAFLACWMHQIEFLNWTSLPITKSLALTIDELLEALLVCCRANDLQGFKYVLLIHFGHHDHAVDTNGQIASHPVSKIELETLQAITDWAQANDWTRKFVDQQYWELISSQDAEWSSLYFAGRQSRPLFPLVMVRPQEGLLENLKVASRRNIIFRPVRRLFEFLYALAFYIRFKRWPLKAPTPKTLAGILYRPGCLELAEESLISNYFDGTTTVTLDLVLEHWEQLLHHFMPTRLESERAKPPFPMIMLALHWQSLLVQDKGRSFWIPDMKRYEASWTLRRRQWSVLQAQQDSARQKAGPSARQPIDWPAWSFSQSTSSC